MRCIEWPRIGSNRMHLYTLGHKPADGLDAEEDIMGTTTQKRDNGRDGDLGESEETFLGPPSKYPPRSFACYSRIIAILYLQFSARQTNSLTSDYWPLSLTAYAPGRNPPHLAISTLFHCQRFLLHSKLPPWPLQKTTRYSFNPFPDS